MTEIPEDIREKAMAICREIYSESTVVEHMEIISHALLAHEREVIERCAKIAETADEDDDRLDRQVRANAAAAIRETAR